MVRPRRLLVLLLGLIVGTLNHAATADKLRAFDIPAGVAAEQLLKFSEQAGVQVLFPSDVVQGLQSKSVSGNLEPRVALDRMLAGMDVVIVADDAAGSVPARRGAPAGGEG